MRSVVASRREAQHHAALSSFVIVPCLLYVLRAPTRRAQGWRAERRRVERWAGAPSAGALSAGAPSAGAPSAARYVSRLKQVARTSRGATPFPRGDCGREEITHSVCVVHGVCQLWRCAEVHSIAFCFYRYSHSNQHTTTRFAKLRTARSFVFKSLLAWSHCFGGFLQKVGTNCLPKKHHRDGHALSSDFAYAHAYAMRACEVPTLSDRTAELHCRGPAKRASWECNSGEAGERNHR